MDIFFNSKTGKNYTFLEIGSFISKLLAFFAVVASILVNHSSANQALEEVKKAHAEQAELVMKIEKIQEIADDLHHKRLTTEQLVATMREQLTLLQFYNERLWRLFHAKQPLSEFSLQAVIHIREDLLKADASLANSAQTLREINKIIFKNKDKELVHLHNELHCLIQSSEIVLGNIDLGYFYFPDYQQIKPCQKEHLCFKEPHRAEDFYTWIHCLRNQLDAVYTKTEKKFSYPKIGVG